MDLYSGPNLSISYSSIYGDIDSNFSESNETFSGSGGSACCVPGSERYIVPALFGIVVVLGCIGNSLVLVVVLKNGDYQRNTTSLFILNLAVADMLFLVFCVPFHAVIYTSSDWPFGEFMCKLVHLIQYASMIASILTLIIMALDRFLAVGYPLETKHLRTPGKALASAIIIWLTSVVVALPWPIVYTVRIYRNIGPEPIAICADDWGGGVRNRATYFLFLFIIGYVIPLAAIFVLSSLMIRQLWLIREPSDAIGRRRGHGYKQRLMVKRKVTRLVIVIVSVFCFCWLPSHIVWLWTNYSPNTWRRTYPFLYFRIGAHVLSYANSSMNPVIYAFLSANFRKGFQRALHCNDVTGSPRATTLVATTAGGVRTTCSFTNGDKPASVSHETSV